MSAPESRKRRADAEDLDDEVPSSLPWIKRPRLEGRVTVKAKHKYNPEAPEIDVELSLDDAQFQPQPLYWGNGDRRILYLNFADNEWYQKQLINPVMVLWVVCKEKVMKNAYVMRRFIEEAVALNIQVVRLNPRTLPLLVPCYGHRPDCARGDWSPFLARDASNRIFPNRLDLLSPDGLPLKPLESTEPLDAMSDCESLQQLLPQTAGVATEINVDAAIGVAASHVQSASKLPILSGFSVVRFDGHHRYLPMPDVVLTRCGANINYHGISLIRHLETMGCTVINRLDALMVSRDKFFTHQVGASHCLNCIHFLRISLSSSSFSCWIARQVMSAHGIPLPKSVMLTPPLDPQNTADLVQRHLSFPVIVKSVSGSLGRAVWKADDRESLKTLLEQLLSPPPAPSNSATTVPAETGAPSDALEPVQLSSVPAPTVSEQTATEGIASNASSETASTVTSAPSLSATGSNPDPMRNPLLFQQYISYSHGRDIRVIVIGNRAVAAMLRQSTNGDFKANISQGGVATQVELSPQLAELAVRVTQLCGLDFAGVDILIDHDGYKLCEVNSSPFFEGLEQATQFNVPKAQLLHILQRFQSSKSLK